MATVQVVREPTAAQAQRSVVRDGGLAISSGGLRLAKSSPLARGRRRASGAVPRALWAPQPRLSVQARLCGSTKPSAGP